jgi:hypothetical protein
MKISSMPAGAGGTPGIDLGNIHVGTTASAEKLAAAKALAAGQEPERKQEDAQTERAPDIRRIKMRTNVSPDRFDAQVAEISSSQTGQEPSKETPNSTTSDANGQAQAAVESTQPLSPQFAALAKQRRELQVMKQELAKERQAIEQAKSASTAEAISKADILANPLKIFELGLTYDQLTEAILANQSGVTPEINALKEELRRVKEDVNKTFTERDTQAEKQALAEMRKEAQSLIQQGDTYEMTRETGSLPHVMDLIYRTYKKHGELLSVPEALNLVETDLINETLKIANIKKVRSQLVPEVPVQTTPQSQGKQMKTLTSRDGALMPLDRRARAIAAMNGTLRK